VIWVAVAVSGMAQDTAESIIAEYERLISMDNKEIGKLIVELGDQESAKRKEALEKAARLNADSLALLIQKLNASDDPELHVVAKALEPLWRARPRISAGTIEIARKAVQGDAYSQGVLGSIFRRGDSGLRKNPAEALRWSQKSADQQHPLGFYSMAQLYQDGCGVEKDTNQVNTLCTRCLQGMRDLAERGDFEAQCDLGWMYDNGRGVDTNCTLAMKWFLGAAKHGYARAQFSVGWMHEMGRGVKTNHLEAVKWYRKAAEQGFVRAQCSMGWMSEFGKDVKTNHLEAVKWYRTAADRGDARAECELARMYRDGKGVDEDDVEAVKWYRKAAEQEYADGEFYLGYMYFNGIGVSADAEEAVKWYRKAATHGCAGAQCNLGVAYKYGRGVAQNDAEAISWYRKAAEQGYIVAQCNLGSSYEFGRCVEKDEAEAVKWYRKAADQGDDEGQCSLANMCCSGRGIAKDEHEAVKLYRKSAEQGNVNAQNDLAWLYATSSDPDLRSGKEAVAYALKAVAADSDEDAYIDTLAAAYARDGQFDKAVKTQIRALELFDVHGCDVAGRKELEERLDIYKKKEAYTDKPAIVSEKPKE
jgi:TPR repeat protein